MPSRAFPWQADDIDSVTWLDVFAPAGSLVEVEVTDLVDDCDFSARVVFADRYADVACHERLHARELPLATPGVSAVESLMPRGVFARAVVDALRFSLIAAAAASYVACAVERILDKRTVHRGWSRPLAPRRTARKCALRMPQPESGAASRGDEAHPEIGRRPRTTASRSRPPHGGRGALGKWLLVW